MFRRCKRRFLDLPLAQKFVGIFVVLTLLSGALMIGALHLGLSVFEEKFYEKSLQELDFFVQRVDDDIQDIDTLTRSIAVDSNIQEQLNALALADPQTANYYYLLTGVRPLLLCGIAVLTGNLCDRLVSLLRRRVYQGSDFSNESFALVIALLMPVTVDIYVLIAAVLAGVLIGKEIFGGYGSYPFNPAAVGYVVAAVSWPEQVFRYPQPYTNIPLWDASMVPVSSAIEDTLRSGGMLNIGSLALGLGEYAAPMGTGAALVILACGLFLWTQKDAHMSASISFLVTCAVIAFFFPRQAGLADSAVLSNILPRLQCVRDELLTGAILFSAVFLINEPYTCVHHRMGRVLYGVLVGVVSMGFRYYGVYETGVCFALLAVNSVSAWIDRTEAKLYHLTHLQADAGRRAAQ